MICVFWICVALPRPLAAQDDTAPLRLGVIGTITALDPVQINTLTLDIAQDMPVISPLGPRSGRTLRLGHTLALTLEKADRGWDLKRALHIYPLIGQVSAIEDGVLVVMGSRVIGTAPDMFDGIKPGYWVGISGLWQGDQLMASRAGAIPPTGFAQLSGSYVAPEIDTSNARIGGTTIIGPLGDKVTTGDFWAISGAPTENAIKVVLKSTRIFAGKVDLVLAQGYPSEPLASETYTLLGTGLLGYATESDMPDPDRPGLVCGIDGTILRKPPLDKQLASVVAQLGCLPQPQNGPR